MEILRQSLWLDPEGITSTAPCSRILSLIRSASCALSAGTCWPVAARPAGACKRAHHGLDRVVIQAGSRGHPDWQGHDFSSPHPPREHPRQRRGWFFERRCRRVSRDGEAVRHDHITILRVRAGLHDPLPDARAGPAIEAGADRGGRLVLRGQTGPGNAGAQDVENASDHAPVINPLHTARRVGSTGLMKSHSKSLMSNRPMLRSDPLFCPKCITSA